MRQKTNDMRLQHIASNLRRGMQVTSNLQEWKDFWNSSYNVGGFLMWNGMSGEIAWKNVGGGCGFIYLKEKK